MMWRCHNKEYYLRPQSAKALYMQSISESLKKDSLYKNVFIHGFCVMDNHYHQATSYKESSTHLSKHMRYAHGLFGARYNKVNKRSGKVAESRPKTALIENIEHEMKVQFYIEANPIRAKMCKLENLKLYKYNSFKFYAYGIKDEYSNLLTIPQWYLELGKTPKERQRKYRQLFYAYLSEQINPDWNSQTYEQNFIGSVIWKLKQESRISTFRKVQFKNST